VLSNILRRASNLHHLQLDLGEKEMGTRLGSDLARVGLIHAFVGSPLLYVTALRITTQRKDRGYSSEFSKAPYEFFPNVTDLELHRRGGLTKPKYSLSLYPH
jgi:hypothetical protein